MLTGAPGRDRRWRRDHRRPPRSSSSAALDGVHLALGALPFALAVRRARDRGVLRQMGE